MTMSRRNNAPRGVNFTEPSLTEQSHAETVNINHIMARYQRNRVLDHVNMHQGTYNDYANAPTYYEAQCVIANANSMFESVPPHIRADFQNDPAQFVDFMQNPENREAIEEYGFDASHLPEPDECVTTQDGPASGGSPRMGTQGSQEASGDAHKQIDMEAALKAGVPESVLQGLSGPSSQDG